MRTHAYIHLHYIAVQQPTNVNYEEVPLSRPGIGGKMNKKHMVFEAAHRKARERVLKDSDGYHCNYKRVRQIWQDQILSKVRLFQS